MNEMSSAVVEPFKPVVESMVRTNRVVVGQVEKWIALQMDSLKAYVDLGVAQMKVAFKITDPHGLHEFADSQFAVLSFVGHRMVDDGRALTGWVGDCANQTNRLTRTNLLSVLFRY